MAENGTRRKRPGKPKRGRPAGRDPEVTRAWILRAARTVFGLRGYSATSVRMVAEQAGLSVTGVYYHFSSLEEIYDEVVADTVATLEAIIGEVLEQPTIRAQIRALIFAMHRLDSQDRSIMAFMVRTYLDAARSPEVGRDSGPLTAGTAYLFVTMVRSAISRGELPPDSDVRTTVGLLASILWGVGLYSGFVEDADAMAVILNQVDDMFAHGLVGPGSSEKPPRLVG
ncbi:AcrR family transcriptional regulator [Mycolicibacterium sp. 624]|uniref:TetR/AcrR family transcriptional regulator n=1 Tax=Mycolicibacterium sp. YH-1 TaxID=2908837 RepID=UPI001F4C3BDC|nr:TetR/AcrR family transcriptional regulator [Mycolicibacterium sp. YH-1]UNB52329.1 TetR/AcrR family transcriptional regulator [Mycolicibacterium sp. YH-1]